jgi:hypothetical protein
MTDKFKDRYVLGVGYPWTHGTGPTHHVQLWNKATGGSLMKLKLPNELYQEECPKYRLVLERVDE